MKRKIAVFLFSLLCDLVALAQTTESSLGTHFEQSLSWNQILQKAKQENKPIFLDCYASWCGPCKLMDKNVYPDKEVGEYMNDKFISVKVQIDKTDTDNQNIKKWYKDAAIISRTYTINSFPTLLFFSSEGKPLHRHSGSTSAEEFISIAKDAFDPQKQYYSVLNSYKPGVLDTSELKGLARSFILTDKNLAGEMSYDYLGRISEKERLTKDNILFIGQFKADPKVKGLMLGQISRYSKEDYKDSVHQQLLSLFTKEKEVQDKVGNYLNSLSNSELHEKGNLMLFSYFTMIISPGDTYFNLFFKQSKKLDKIMGVNGRSQAIIDFVLYSSIIFPEIKKADSLKTDMDWGPLYQKVKNKSNANYAERNISSAKVTFYQLELSKAEQANSEEKFKWGEKLSTALYGNVKDKDVKKMTADNLWNAVILNNRAWIVFQYSSSKEELQKAIWWSSKVLEFQGNKPSAEDIDTYANLLYKTGQKERAIDEEKKAVELSPKQIVFQETLEKMQKGQLTWPTKK